MTPAPEITITGEPTLDPQVCKFVLNVEVYPAGSFNCRSREMAAGSPLLEALFAIEDIGQVMVSGKTLTIAKTNTDDWSVMGKQIGPVIREQCAHGGRLIDPQISVLSSSEKGLSQQIEKLFSESINPQIASHGGSVELVRMEGTTAYLRLAGGCQGCSSAAATLKLGIEKAIRQAVPEVSEVIDITDHDSGTNPYFS